jgi:hypothetical protein
VEEEEEEEGLMVHIGMVLSTENIDLRGCVCDTKTQWSLCTSNSIFFHRQREKQKENPKQKKKPIHYNNNIHL